MSGEGVRSRMSIEEIFDIKSSYIIAQVAHITCKKDHHEILSATVSDRLSKGYEKLQSHVIVFVKLSTYSTKVKAVMISKNAIGIKLECDSMGPTVCYLTYQISGSSFTMTHQDKARFPAGSKLIFIMPPFSLFIPAI
jgi:hypothetical protein